MSTKEILQSLLLIFLLCASFCVMEIDTQSEDVSDLNGDYCRQKWSCDVPDIDDRNCKCDSRCTLFNDCCVDINNTSQTLRTHVPKFNCEYISEIYSESFIFVVQTCPLETRKDLAAECEGSSSPDSKIPVTGIKTGYTYRNMFCAACHREEFLSWQVGFSCKWRYRSMVNKTLDSMQQDEHCSKVYHPPHVPRSLATSKINYDARKCFPFIDSCISNEHATECKNGEVALVFDDHVYKNVDCAVCNNIDKDNLTCSARTWKLRPSGEKRKITNYSYRLLFDFNTNDATGTYVKHFRTQHPERNRKSCPDRQVYDPFSDVCRKVNCLFPLVFDDGKCVYIRYNVDGNKTDTNGGGNDGEKCVYVKLNYTEYEIINQTNIFIYSINKTIDNDAFYHVGDYTYVCESELQITVEERISVEIYHQSESILSFVGSVLSITALTITLILYLRFPKLRNTPGKSLICLMLCLIVAQLLFLFANEVEDRHHFCIGFAVTIHYAFLASVFWMNCMSFDIFITFSKGFVKSNGDKSSKTFVWYSLYSWLCPLFIVVSGVCLDVFTANDYRPRYGEIVCWIGNKRAILVYFMIPVALLVTANLFFYVFTIRSIFLSNRQTNRILRQKKSCKLLVYVKLSIVMGLTWVFAYVASLTNELVFWYLFIFFNSWQGVFIFISFVCFGKARTLVIDRVRVVSSFFQSRTQSTILTNSSKH